LKTSNAYSVGVTANTGSQTTTLPTGSGEVLVVNDSTTISAYLNLHGNEATVSDWELKPEEVLVLSDFRTKAISYITSTSTAALRILVLY